MMSFRVNDYHENRRKQSVAFVMGVSEITTRENRPGKSHRLYRGTFIV